jgi:hypothetical protein
MKRPLFIKLSSLSTRAWKTIGSDRQWQRLSYVWILCVGILMLATFLDYGLTWDEEAQRINGDNILAWYSSWFRDRRALDFTSMYGGFFDVVAQLAAKVLPLGIYESRHLINCLFGLLAIYTAYKLGAYIGNPMAGFFAALFLTLTPAFYGHSFNNPKDIPFATLYLIALYFILVSYKSLPQLPRNLVMKIGVTIGLALGVRVGGLMLFSYLAVVSIAWLIICLRFTSDDFNMSRRKMILALCLRFACIVGIAWVVMLVCWPWAQVKPLINPFRALATFSNFGTTLTSFFDGQFISAAELPWSYLPIWFSISLPEFYVISLLAGCLPVCAGLLRLKKAVLHSEQLSALARPIIERTVLVMAACLPIILAILMHSRLYDAMRHFLFIIPPLAILAGGAFATLLQSKANWLVKAAFSILIIISAGLTTFDMIQLHPYQYIYFNRTIAGGLKNASQRFETDYWGGSYKEATEWLIQNYHTDGQERIRIANCSTVFLTSYYLEKSEALRQRFMPVETTEDPHIVFATTRNRCHEKHIRRGGQVLHIVERQGVPLLYVIEHRKPQ